MSWAEASNAFALAAILSASAVALLWRLTETARVQAAPPLARVARRRAFCGQPPLAAPHLVHRYGLEPVVVCIAGGLHPLCRAPAGREPQHGGATYGVGMVVGALLASRIVALLPFGLAIIVGPAFSVLAAATMVATLLWPHAALAAFALFLFGAGPIVWTITSTTLRQTVTPSAMLGRVSSMFLTVNMGARPVGAAIGGFVGATWGEAACLLRRVRWSWVTIVKL